VTAENRDDLLVGALCSILFPIAGVYLGVRVIGRGESMGWALLAWSLLTTAFAVLIVAKAVT
jgi:hypothetical protein